MFVFKKPKPKASDESEDMSTVFHYNWLDVPKRGNRGKSTFYRVVTNLKLYTQYNQYNKCNTKITQKWKIANV